jgi:hypothetical protein
MRCFARPAALPAVGSAASIPMRRAIAFLTATTFLAAGCAPPAAPPREPPAHLLLAEAAPEPLPPPPANEPAPKGEAVGGNGIPRAVGWFSIGFGASAGLVALGTSLMMLHQSDLRNAGCNAAKVCTPDGLNANSQLDGLAGWNVASYVAAVAGLGIGTILILTNPKNDRKTAVEVSPNGSGAGLFLRSTF